MSDGIENPAGESTGPKKRGRKAGVPNAPRMGIRKPRVTLSEDGGLTHVTRGDIEKRIEEIPKDIEKLKQELDHLKKTLLKFDAMKIREQVGFHKVVAFMRSGEKLYGAVTGLFPDEVQVTLTNEVGDPVVPEEGKVRPKLNFKIPYEEILAVIG